MPSPADQLAELVSELAADFTGSPAPLLSVLVRRAARVAGIAAEYEYQFLFQLHLDGWPKDKSAGLRVGKWQHPDSPPKWDPLDVFKQDRATARGDGAIWSQSLEQIERIHQLAISGGAEAMGRGEFSAIATFEQSAQGAAEILGRVRNRVGLFLHAVEARPVMKPSSTPVPAGDPRKVFVVHGRNKKARDAVFQFLRALGLQPLEWEHAVRATGSSSPYIGEVIEAGMNEARAVLVLFTEDDEARLRQHLQDNPKADPEALRGQPRPNVLIEAGMALQRGRERTVIVEIGELRKMSDLDGIHTVRLDGTAEERNRLVSRLEGAGCSVDRTGGDWLSAGDFAQFDSFFEQLGRKSKR